MTTDQGWWVIKGEHLLEMLREVSMGADPDTVFIEAYANCKHEYHEGDDDE